MALQRTHIFFLSLRLYPSDNEAILPIPKSSTYIFFFHLIAKNEKGFWLLAKSDIKIGIYQHIL